MSFKLYHGDLRDVLPILSEHSLDSCVTDPPYELGFMNKKWDATGVAFDPETWKEVFRVLKPGAYLVAFGGTRTYHRMACAIEDAGFDIRDQMGWMYGSGFPKSHNLKGENEGKGTALKPAWEPIVLARKPLIGTVFGNHELLGTGVLNIDACRIEGDNPSAQRRKGAINHLSDRPAAETESEGRMVSRQSPEAYRAERAGETFGRWPANLMHDGSDEVREFFPRSNGQQGDLNGHSRDRLSLGIYGDMRAARDAQARRDEDTSAARFFWSPKASKKEREVGLSEVVVSDGREKAADNAYQRGKTKRLNPHPTVKPVALMQYLCRLVTPPGGKVLDCFMGSGSTGRAAMLEGLNFIGVEKEAAYLPVARARIEHASVL